MCKAQTAGECFRSAKSHLIIRGRSNGLATAPDRSETFRGNLPVRNVLRPVGSGARGFEFQWPPSYLALVRFPRTGSRLHLNSPTALAAARMSLGQKVDPRTVSPIPSRSGVRFLTLASPRFPELDWGTAVASVNTRVAHLTRQLRL